MYIFTPMIGMRNALQCIPFMIPAGVTFQIKQRVFKYLVAITVKLL